jgi:hypothetical protein
MHFVVLGKIERVEIIAVGGRIRDIMRLRRQFGPGRWRKLKGIARVRLRSGDIRMAEMHWYEAHGMAKETAQNRFALCVQNEDCEDLVLRKVYQVLPDKRAERDGYIRVIDESGEDYLYPESYFVFVRLPRKAQDAVSTSA